MKWRFFVIYAIADAGREPDDYTVRLLDAVANPFAAAADAP